MSTKTLWESFEAKSENVVERVKQIVHEGNVRRVVVKGDGSIVAEFPLTDGAVGAVAGARSCRARRACCGDEGLND
jgi:hypothetical protein